MAKKATFRRFDVAEHLDNPEMVAAFLAAALEEAGDDLAEVTGALNTVARAGNLSQLARSAGVTREGLYKALSPDGNPSFELVRKIVKSLGLQLTVVPAK